jgi:hypothetical protein
MNEHEPDPLSRPPSPPAAANGRILLLDCDTRRRDARATALRERGVLVDSVGTGEDARSLWKPGTHKLVLIEFRSASPDVYDFHQYAQGACSRQKFGFYIAKPPYLTSSYIKYEADAGQQGRFRLNLPKAPRHLSVANPLRRSGSDSEQHRSPSTSFSDAVKSAEQDFERRART